MADHQPIVSIIIPVYNREKLLVETLHSIREQTYQNWECIIVDDHSTDRSWKVAASFCEKDSRFQRYERPQKKPKGANACRNYGLTKAKGRWIQWFDSDDLMDHRNLEARMQKANSSNKINLIVSKLKYFGDPDSVRSEEGRQKKICSDDLQKDYYLNNLTWITGSLTFRKDILTNPEILFSERIHRAQEYLFVSELLSKQKISLGCIEENLVFHRLHKESITGRFIDKRKRELKSTMKVNKKTFVLLPREMKVSKVCFDKFWYAQLHNMAVAFKKKYFVVLIIALVEFVSLVFSDHQFLERSLFNVKNHFSKHP